MGSSFSNFHVVYLAIDLMSPLGFCALNIVLHVSSECGQSGYFLQITPQSCKEEHLFKEIGSQILSAPSGEKSSKTTRQDHSNMASNPSSSSRSNLERGEWERCSVSHSRLAKQQTQGFLPPADLVPFEQGWPPSTAKPRQRIFPIRLRENGCASSPIC